MIFVGALLAVVRWRGDPPLWPLIGAVVSFALINAVFFTVLRYRMAFEPCLLWMAGRGLGRRPVAPRRRPAAGRVSPRTGSGAASERLEAVAPADLLALRLVR